MKIYIRNMVCARCMKSVASILCRLKIEHGEVLLGEVTLLSELDDAAKHVLSEALREEGFELIDDKKTRTIEQIKKLVLIRMNQDPDDITINLSDFLSSELHLEYSYLSTLFSSIEGITIEKYYISQKIEKAKELLVYDELSLSEISYKLGYSSVQHLSNQFRKVTGLTPSHFKSIGASKRKPIDQIH